ncbi:MAG: hypothetical protein WBW88_08425, partial [Rhodothermales bacterium]
MRIHSAKTQPLHGDHSATVRFGRGQVALVLMLALSLFSCSSLNKTEKGAAVGAGAGAVVGGVIG